MGTGQPRAERAALRRRCTSSVRRSCASHSPGRLGTPRTIVGQAWRTWLFTLVEQVRDEQILRGRGAAYGRHTLGQGGLIGGVLGVEEDVRPTQDHREGSTELVRDV